MAVKDIKTQEELDKEMGTPGSKFLLFHSPWDSFCLEIIPVYEKIAANNPGSFSKVNTDTVTEAAVIYAVDTLPAVLFFRDGKLVKRLDGVPEKGIAADKLAEFVWACRGVINNR